MNKNRAKQVFDLNYYNHEQSNRVYDPNASSPTIRAEGKDYATGIKILEENISIRKLTPRECFRLMGVRDEDIDKLSDLSDGTQYHLAGDSIVVNVLMAIFKQMGVEK